MVRLIGPHSIIGRSIILTAGEDDLGRVSCSPPPPPKSAACRHPACFCSCDTRNTGFDTDYGRIYLAGGLNDVYVDPPLVRYRRRVSTSLGIR